MAREARFKKELLDELLAGQDAKTVFEQDGLLDELKKALAERILNTEMDVHLDREVEQAAGNHRNGVSPKTVLTDSGKLELAIPRDRQGRFEPALIAKYQLRFPGLDQKIIALYAHGMTTRDIQAHLRELYGIEISPELVSAVTEPCSTRCRRGKHDRWNRSTRSCSSTVCASRPGMKARSRTRRCTWPSACVARATRKCWGSGSSRPKGPSSGCG